MTAGTAQRWLQLSQQLNEAQDVEEVLCRLLSEAVALTGADGGVVRVHEPEDLALLKHNGDWEWLADDDLDGNGGGEPLLPAGLRERLGVASTLKLPLAAGGAEMGAVLVLFSRQLGVLPEATAPRLAELVALGTLALGRVATHQRLHGFSQRLVDAQEEERGRLARELHDSAGQSLTALKLALSLLQKRIGAESSHAPLMDEAVELVNTVQEEIQAMSLALQPPMLATAGLNGSLRGLCHEFGRQSGLRISFEGVDMAPLDERASTAFYRLLQEALANVARDDRATVVTVRLQHAGDMLSLVVRDDGAGRPPGPGLRALRERFEVTGGIVEITTSPDAGTEVVGTYRL
jgi:signal transduction histidine kinase